MLTIMKTQEELRAEFHRLFAADLLDEAEALLEQLEPLGDEEWRKVLNEAPLDDEPVTASERSGFDEIRRMIASESQKRAG
jgi:hypothetical protein